MFFSKKTTGGPVEWLIVGLGNPGRQYENAQIKRLKFKAVVGEAEISGKRCLLMKPDTFMNLSGQAVVEAMNFYKVPIERVVVLCDDISLEPGRLRIPGKDSFPRIRLGVGKKPHPDYDLADWVLSRFGSDELKRLEEACGVCPEAVRLILEGKIDLAMNQYNS